MLEFFMENKVKAAFQMNYLDGQNIKLRAPEKSDLELLYEWENNTSFWHIGATITPFSKHVLSKYLEIAHLDLFEAKQLRLMIDLKPDGGRTIGSIDLFDYEPFHERVGVGILIADLSDRGRGYASEALELLIHYTFDLLGLHQLYCNVSADNEISLKLFQKHGFKIVGLKKAWSRRGNTWNDEYLLQLINNQ
jgi:diamine N-acetyltransferase